MGGTLGKCESWDGTVDYELTDEEAMRLETAARKEPLLDFSDNEAIADIYEKVRTCAFEQNKKAMGSFIIEELRRDNDYYANLSDDQIVEEEMGQWSVDYPEELQCLLN